VKCGSFVNVFVNIDQRREGKFASTASRKLPKRDYTSNPYVYITAGVRKDLKLYRNKIYPNGEGEVYRYVF